MWCLLPDVCGGWWWKWEAEDQGRSSRGVGNCLSIVHLQSIEKIAGPCWLAHVCILVGESQTYSFLDCGWSFQLFVGIRYLASLVESGLPCPMYPMYPEECLQIIVSIWVDPVVSTKCLFSSRISTDDDYSRNWRHLKPNCGWNLWITPQ